MNNVPVLQKSEKVRNLKGGVKGLEANASTLRNFEPRGLEFSQDMPHLHNAYLP